MRARMAALSLRFPGALRELDDLEVAEIARRLGSIEAVLHARAAVEPWMQAIAMFHALARGALCAKRWLLGRKDIDVEVERAYGEAVGGFAFPDDARAWENDLQRIASPPRGRVTDAVLARLAHSFDTTVAGARLLVFGVPRRERKAAMGRGSS